MKEGANEFFGGLLRWGGTPGWAWVRSQCSITVSRSYDDTCMMYVQSKAFYKIPPLVHPA